MRALILAGGLGTRLKDRIADLPKPMAYIHGRPFLEYVLDKLIDGGVTEIILSVGYKADAILRHFGHMYRTLHLQYSIEPQALGTGGAVAYALRNESEPTLVLNGDTFLDLDYRRFLNWYYVSPSQFAIVLCEVADVGRYGCVYVEDGIVTSFSEKQQVGAGLINSGVYIIAPGVFRDFGLSGKFSLESDLLQSHCDVLKPRAFLTRTYFIDIGIPEDYDRAQLELPNIAM